MKKMSLIRKMLLFMIVILLLIVIFVGFIYPRYIVNLNKTDNQIEVNSCLDVSYLNGDDLNINGDLETKEKEIVIVNKCEDITNYTISLETFGDSNILDSDIDIIVNEEVMKLEYLPSGIKTNNDILESYMIVQGSLASNGSKVSYKIKLKVNKSEMNDFHLDSKVVVY